MRPAQSCCTAIGATVNEVNHNCQVETQGQTEETPSRPKEPRRFANHKSKQGYGTKGAFR